MKLIFDNIENHDNLIIDFKEQIHNKVRDFEIQFTKSEIYVNKQTKNLEGLQEEIYDSIEKLNNQIIKSESHVKGQTKNLEGLQEEIYDTLKKLDIEKLERTNESLIRKVKYLEEVFEKFNEQVLTEGLLNEPPNVQNSDPLTPLDQKFVTFDQLKNHYQTFINRVQQQLATLGGGGETRLEFLDDVDRDSAKQNGYVLQYNSSVGKFIGTSYVPGGGGGTGESFWVQTNAGIHTLSNVGIGTTNPTVEFEVNGRIVGTSATFTGTLNEYNSPIVSVASSTSSDPTNFGILGVGRTVGFEDTNIIAHFTDDVDSYSQVIVQNHNSGTSSSADFIVNNNQEEGVQYYGDFGINGSNFILDPEDAFSEPNGVYLYSAGGSLTIGSQDTVPLKFAVNFTEVARVEQNGIGIGTTVITSTLTVNGDANIIGILTATDFNSASDIKLKQNITAIDNPLDTISKLEGVNFQWKKSGKKSMGVIAQEVEKVVPELVSGFSDKTVNYNGLIAILIECVKKQQEEIEELKKYLPK